MDRPLNAKSCTLLNLGAGLGKVEVVAFDGVFFEILDEHAGQLVGGQVEGLLVGPGVARVQHLAVDAR